jgi:hypothetical protein
MQNLKITKNQFDMEQKTTAVATAKRGLSPGVPALIYFLLFAGGITFNMISTSGASFPTPYETVEKAQRYYGTYSSTIRTYSLFMFWSALPLGIYTALITTRLRTFNVHRGGTPIALFGGIAASVFIALSALCTWVLSQPGIATGADAMRVVQLLGFAAGGTGNVVMAGLLVAGISIESGIGRLIPKYVMISGIFIAAVSVLSMLSMVFPALAIMLPIGRFLGMLWMIIAGFSIKKPNQLNS